MSIPPPRPDMAQMLECDPPRGSMTMRDRIIALCLLVGGAYMSVGAILLFVRLV